MGREYKYRITGTYEFVFKVDEDETDPLKSTEEEITELIARVNLPFGFTPIKTIAKIKESEKELLEDGSDG